MKAALEAVGGSFHMLVEYITRTSEGSSSSSPRACVAIARCCAVERGTPFFLNLWRFAWRLAHRIRPRPSKHPNKRRTLPVLMWAATQRQEPLDACTQRELGPLWSWQVMVPKLVDEAEGLTEVTAFATANSSQSFLEDADDDVVDPAASLVQMLGMERGEALPLCTFSQPSTSGASQVGAVSVECVLLFPAVCFFCQNFVVSHLTSRLPALCVRGEL